MNEIYFFLYIWNIVVRNQVNLCLQEHWLEHADDEDLKVILQRSKDYFVDPYARCSDSQGCE